MDSIQQSNSIKKFRPLTFSERLAALGVFLIILLGFGLVYSSARGWVDMGRLFGVCGFRQMYSLPCPGCYMTHSAQAFVKGRIAESFYIQPAGAVFCVGFAAVGIFALLTAVIGVDFGILNRDIASRLFKYILIAAVIVLVGGWAVTLARALSQGGV
jgi:hypothetical protein